MPVLHMEISLVRDVSAQIQAASVSLDQQLRHVSSYVQQLMFYEWQGPSADMFASEIQLVLQRVNQAAKEGGLLSQRLQKEADEWERVASVLGAEGRGNVNGVGSSKEQNPSRILTDDLPKDQGDLFELVSKDSEVTPVKILQIGENEYLVTIAGTDGFSPKNNWTHALTSGAGMRGDYEVDVHNFINANILPGAKIHFAGHSQGGIVANNLADFKDFSDRYQIDTITTFGAPVSSRPNPSITYYRYEANGDIVPDLRGYWILNPSSAEQTEQIQVSTYEQGTGYYKSGLLGAALLGPAGGNLGQNVYGTFDSSEGAHSSYGKQMESLPFDIDPAYWQVENLRISQADDTSGTGQVLQGGTAVVWQAVDAVVDYPTEMIFDNELWRQGQQNVGLPDVRVEIDRYMDRAGEGLLFNAGEVGDSVQTGAESIVNMGRQGINSISDGWSALWK